jgi:hypothetical protein
MEKIRILDPGFGINIPDDISKSLIKIFSLKIHRFFVAKPDSGYVAFLSLNPG